MKIIKHLIIFIILVFATPYLFAETIILKSGQEIKGKIVKYTADYIIIRSDSKESTIYFKDDIIANIGGTPYGRYGRKLGPVKNTLLPFLCELHNFRYYRAVSKIGKNFT